VQVLERHEDMVFSVAWNPSGTRIVSGSGDKTLRVWESRLEEALPMWRASASRRRVHTLYQEHIFLPPVLTALRADPGLSPKDRQTALRMANARGNPSASELNSMAWPLVDPDRKDKTTDAAYGLRLARAAVKLAPGDSMIRDTLAWALFANSLYDKAIAASERALELAPDDEKEEYRGFLEKLRTMVEEARAANAPAKPGSNGS